ncbi:MAG: heparinase II/III family protein [Myxococcota bacterium]
MSRVGSAIGLLGKLPTVLRTLRPLRREQALAQIHHALFGLPEPSRAEGEAPSLLLDTPKTAFLPPPAHVRALASPETPARIQLLETAFDLGDRTDWETDAHGPLFAYHLHQHEYLRLEMFSPEARAARMLDWVKAHPKGRGWDPHPISLRLLCWGKLMLTPGMLALEDRERDALLASMADQAETLAQGLEVRLQANHLLSNRLSVVWAGMLLDGRTSADWRGQAEGLMAELAAQVRPDGGHEERSPMYHALILENVLDLLNVCRAAPQRAPIGLIDALSEAAARMLAALQFWTHPDGDIALFADSGFDVAAKPAALVDYATRLEVPVGVPVEVPVAGGHDSLGKPATGARGRCLPQTGYVRVEDERWCLLASVAGPSPAHQPGHAHCDALSFELSLGAARLITDTGLFEYRPGVRRDQARATASHATLQLDEQEQAEVWSAHRIGGRPEVELLAFADTGFAEAECQGWSQPETVHRRRFEIAEGEVLIRDCVEGPWNSLRSTLPIAPGWEVSLEGAIARAVWRGEAGGERIPPVEMILTETLTWRVARGIYFPTFGVECERPVLVGEATGEATDDASDGASIEFETRFRVDPAVS